MSHVSGKAHAQTARRIIVSTQNIGRRIRSGASREPGLQNGIALLQHRSDFQRSSGKQHQHHPLPRLMQGMNQLLLIFTEPQIRFAGGLSGLPLRLSGSHDTDFAVLQAKRCLFYHIRHISVSSPGKRLCHSRHKPAAQLFLQSFPQSTGIFRPALAVPAAQKITRAGKGTRQPHLTGIRKGKSSLIFQKHHTLPGRLSRCLQVLPAVYHLLFLLLVGVLPGIFKKAQLVFQLQDTDHTLIDFTLCYSSLLQQGLQRTCIHAGHHLDIHPRMDRLFTGLQGIGGHGMVHQLLHRGIIGDHHTVKAPLLPQNSAQ